MLNCKEVTRLVSESFDRKLTLRERFGLRLHTMMCGTCRLFRQLQHHIQVAVRYGSGTHSGGQNEPLGMPDESRVRVTSAVRTALEPESGEYPRF